MATLSPHGRANLPPLETASTSDSFDHSAAMIPGTPGHMAQLGMNVREKHEKKIVVVFVGFVPDVPPLEAPGTMGPVLSSCVRG